ncbi:hypothetical protein [Nonomuraea basaltis]|uniref:hypothetical protein n=1 Tax=Nonomuraea basaltis TaxID=2495887 RepID=UPI00110C4C6E|nr:hypothetical protein [Nonomuraea basaltis]TMR91338.1 hypothetical protein EJK15_50640 [Nonomuraea basaltis]
MKRILLLLIGSALTITIGASLVWFRYEPRSVIDSVDVVSLIVSAVPLLIALWASWRSRTKAHRALSEAEEDPKEVLQRRVERVNQAVATAASEMQALQRDLEAQQAASAALIAQAEEQQRLLEINQEQAEKIRHILVGETKATIRAEGRKQWLFFGLGVLASIPVGVAINIFVP